MAASSGPDNPFSRISLIKARLRSEAGEEKVSEGFSPEAPPAGHYVSAMPFRPASPPSLPELDSGEFPEQSAGFRAASPVIGPAGSPFVRAGIPGAPSAIQKAGTNPLLKAASPVSPVQKAAPPSNPLQKAGPPANPIQKAGPANPIQKGGPANPIQKGGPANPGQTAAATGPLQKSSPPVQSSPLQKATPPGALQKAPPQKDEGARTSDGIQKTPGEPTPEAGGPIILRSRTPSVPTPTPRSSIAGLVTRALGGAIGQTAIPVLQDLAMLVKKGDPSQAPDEPAEEAPPTPSPSATGPPPTPSPPATPTPPRFSTATRLSAPTTRLSAPTTRLGASLEGFLEGKTDGASLKEREFAIALRNLQGAGWSFLTVARQQSNATPTDAAGAYRFLLDEKRVVDPEVGDRLRLVDSRGKAYTVSAADEASSLDYFHGTGAPTSLKNPALAKKLQGLAGMGIQPEGDDAHVPGVWGAYVTLTRGKRALLKIEDVVFAEVHGSQPADIDAAAASLAEVLTVYRTLLLPEARAGRLRQNGLGQVLQSLSWDVPGVSLVERVRTYLRLAAAVRAGPESGADLAEQTTGGVRAYEAILELDLGGDAFGEAVATMETLIAAVGSERAHDPLHFLYQESARSSPFPQARQERVEVFRRVLGCGVDPDDAIAVTQVIVSRAWDEPLEARVQLFEALAELAAHQPGYLGVMEDYQTVLRYRSTRDRLEDAARPYLAIFEALVERQEAAETACTWAFVHEGLRLGQLEGGEHALYRLSERFVELLGQIGNVQEARLRLMH